MILERYVIREVCAPLLAICTVLVMIFAGYSAIRFLNDAVNGLLTGWTVVTLVCLKVLIALEVLLPATLYLSVVLALSRLHTDSEVTAMEACGVGQRRIVTAIFSLALALSLVVTGLSLFARPWAYNKIYTLEATGKNEFDFAKVEAGQFYELGKNVVFFAEELDAARMRARNVWVWELGERKREVTTARDVYQVNGPGPGQKAIVFLNGRHYSLDPRTGTDLVVQFQQNVFQLEAPKPPSPEYRRKATLTTQLAQSSAPADIAEFHWRLSTGVSSVLMALLAIPLSRIAPRQNKNGKVTGAIVLFFLCYNLSLIAKTWVEKQTIPTIPGIWWVNLLYAVLVLALLPFPSPVRRIGTWWTERRRGKIS